MGTAEKDEWITRNAAGLDEGEHFKKFVERSKTTGHEYEGDAVFYETNFAREKVMKMDRDIRVRIAFLFVRQFDVQADGSSLGRQCAAVGSFHDARSAAGDDGEIVFGQFPREMNGGFVIPIGRQQSRGAEHGYAGPDLRECFKRIHEFRHDAKNAPRVFLDEGELVVAVHGGEGNGLDGLNQLNSRGTIKARALVSHCAAGVRV